MILKNNRIYWIKEYYVYRHWHGHVGLTKLCEPVIFFLELMVGGVSISLFSVWILQSWDLCASCDWKWLWDLNFSLLVGSTLILEK